MPVEILMPELGESVHEATVTRWIKQIGEFVKEDDPIVEIMTDKVNTELPAPATGVLAQILIPEGGTVQVFASMGVIEEAGAPNAEAAASATETRAKPAPQPVPKPAEQVGPVQSASRSARRWFTPVVRSIARAHGVPDAELGSIGGTGAGGRVTKRDVEAYLASGRRPASAEPAPMGLESKPAPVTTGPDQEVHALVGLRKMIAEAMVRSSQVPTVSTCIHVDVSALVKFRESQRDAFQKQHGLKLTYTPFFVGALTEALLEFPMVNSSLQGEQVVTNRAVHMGVAVALGSKGDEGLIVPVIRDCHRKSIVEIARDLDEIASKARGNALKPDDVHGGTFTLTNPGSYGALFGTPMINAPQAGIAGAYGIQKVPVVVGEDMIAIRSMMYLVLTYDHRIVDGLLAGRFLQSVKRRLEEVAFDQET